MERAKAHKKELHTALVQKAVELSHVERQKRDAINNFRPIKRQYVHSYRTTCIKRQEILTRRQKDLDLIKGALGYTMIKLHKRDA